ncbi:adenylate/guanylate cyclase domain-containing protein [Candidatus Halobeggiatoa sp. HSG11]|nr:adenylate/guanylate cyclase domain-containing protein [Candidatus Halobeggiatoa sp. HSG11]
MNHFISQPLMTNEKYATWCNSFIWKRLRFGIIISIAVVFTFIILNLTHYQSLNHHWLYTNLTQEILLILSLGLLYLPIGRKYPELIFLLFSWAITLSPIYWFAQIEIAKLDFVTWSLVFLGQATLLPLKWKLHLLSQLVVLAFFLILGINLPFEAYIIAIGPIFLLLYLFWFCLICNLSIYLHENLQHSEFKAKLHLQLEQKKSERLLLNILPKSIATRLKQNPTIVADNFSKVTVLFADIVGFTEMSGKISPPKLVEMLNEIFSKFDNLVELHNLEKIKTIGDAYMVVAGLPDPEANSIADIANLALEMQLLCKKRSDLKIRIGIHTGPVVAGVIGIKKFAYDLWGDTVNTASRMESHGITNKIQVSDNVYEELKTDYLLTKRGEISIKGKGNMVTYMLEGKR